MRVIEMVNYDMLALSLDDTFPFACDPSVPCFNDCCRDLNQFLTPYDVLRLKQNLGLDSGEFLERYTRQHTGPESGLPVVTLKPIGGADLKCPFVSPEGCKVYPDRPAACRTYPLVRMLSRDKTNGQMTERFFLVKEPHCQGHLQGQRQTVREWLNDQDLADYNRMNDLLLEVISLKNRLAPGPLDLPMRLLFYQACYDLDAFRPLLRKEHLTRQMKPAAPLETLEADDTVLLAFALAYWQKVFADRTADRP